MARTQTVGETRFLKQFGERVREERKARLGTQSALAARLDAGVPAVSKLESGTANPTLRTLYQVARALGVTPSALLDMASLAHGKS